VAGGSLSGLLPQDCSKKNFAINMLYWVQSICAANRSSAKVEVAALLACDHSMMVKHHLHSSR
jgi:hypothetical protein